MALRILEEKEHLRLHVDPFGQMPCFHETIVVLTTNGESIGDDLAMCHHCALVVTLRDLFAPMKMPPGLMNRVS